MHPGCELLSSLSWSEPLMRMADMCPACELLSSVWTYENHWWECWTCIQTVSCSPVFELIRTTDKNGWHPSRLWVSLHCLSWSEQLMRMAKTSIQGVSHSPLFGQMKITDKNGWTCIQAVSYPPVIEQMRTTDKNGCTCFQAVSCTLVFV